MRKKMLTMFVATLLAGAPLAPAFAQAGGGGSGGAGGGSGGGSGAGGGGLPGASGAATPDQEGRRNLRTRWYSTKRNEFNKRNEFALIRERIERHGHLDRHVP